MNYIEIVNDAIQYIESNLHRNLSLEELVSRYYISPTYFHRIFRAVTNHTVKSYILGRKRARDIWVKLIKKRSDKNNGKCKRKSFGTTPSCTFVSLHKDKIIQHLSGRK